MRRFSALLILFLAVGVGRADGPDDDYVQIYTLIQLADSFNQNGQGRVAAEKYLEAQKALEKLSKVYPNWNEKVVRYRLGYISEKLVPLAQFVPGSNTTNIASEEVIKKLSPAELEAQVKKLGQEVEKISAERDDLQSRLEESFHAKMVPSRELQKAEDKIIALQKERDLLKTSLEEEKAKSKASQTTVSKKGDSRKYAEIELERDEFKKKLDDTTHELASVKDELKRARLMGDQTELKKKLDETLQQLALETARADRSEKKAQEVTAQIKQMEKDRRTLQARLDAALKGIALNHRDEVNAVNFNPNEPDTVTQLDTVRKELATLQALHEEEVRTREAQTQKYASLQADRNELFRKLNQNTTKVERQQERASSDHDFALLRMVESERDQYKKDLDATIKELADLEASRDEESFHKQAGTVSQSKKVQEELAQQLETLRVKLQIFEARPEPFTPEELALFKKPEPQIVKVERRTTSPKETKTPSTTVAPIVGEAENDFANHHFEDAERKYKEALKQDSKNAGVLANLAASQLALEHSDDAEQSIKRALEIDPNDAFSLLMLGKIKFSQGKFDDALDALSRSVKASPDNAETQNYLGMTLSEKGQRQPAEAALRKAIQLQPDNASAHHNLAIVYATQKPPFLELARWHYQKAIDAGHPRNSVLEKMLSDGKMAEKK